jgi:phage terminase large subunit-like protein
LHSSLAALDPKRQELALRLEKERRRQTRKLYTYSPYPKQIEFHATGLTQRERLLRAGNQNGKTFAGGCEVAYHLTGLYPEWWKGRRFERPILAWIGSDTGETTRDNPQRALFGMVGEMGTGAIPGALIGEKKSALGVADLLDYAKIKHVSGGWSTVRCKYYAQGRQKWQGPPVNVVWMDEEPPQDIYSEALARTIATGGIIFTTFTPLLGMTDVVRKLIHTPADTNMTIEDALHIPAEERERIIAQFPPHEREARTKGIPILGSGRIFPVEESIISVQAFEIPRHWVHIGGIDFGWDHPTAAVHLAWDRGSDCVYVVNAYRRSEATPVIHAASVKPWKVKFAWPHDGLQHDKGSGEQLASQYRAQGLSMLPERITFEDGTNGVEAGIFDMLDRMLTGRFKVFAHLAEWFDEFRLYHRKDGRVVKEFDDLLSATRYGIMGLRFAEQLGGIRSDIAKVLNQKHRPIDSAMGF